jgi:16S rRNA (adenine1518-N6/adenine1519-N6)-dimethyltransferase
VQTLQSSILATLKRYNAWSNKSLGQHFLCDEVVFDTILHTANIQPQAVVVEVGPGTGELTKRLLMKTPNVICFEYDRAMQRILREEVPDVQLIAGDVLQTAPDVLDGLRDYSVVANIPYAISSPLLHLLLTHTHRPKSLTLLVQEEVGQRISAQAGKPGRGYLSVLVERAYTARFVQRVFPDQFFPPPKVYSAIVHMEKHQQNLLDRAELQRVQQLFQHPRKQLHNVLQQYVPNGKSEEVLAHCGLPSTVRAQELRIEQWKQLVNTVWPKEVHG